MHDFFVCDEMQNYMVNAYTCLHIGTAQVSRAAVLKSNMSLAMQCNRCMPISVWC